MTRKLLSQQAVYCGGSSGAAVVGAIRYAKKLKSPKKIVILLHDSGNRYSSKIFNNKWMSENNYWNGVCQSSLGQVVKDRAEKKAMATADLSVNLGQVLSLMKKNRTDTVTILDDDEVLGVVQKRELMAPLFEETLTEKDHVSSALSSNFIKLDESEPIQKALKALQEKKTALVCRQGRPVGLIDEDDIIDLLKEK